MDWREFKRRFKPKYKLEGEIHEERLKKIKNVEDNFDEILKDEDKRFKTIMELNTIHDVMTLSHDYIKEIVRVNKLLQKLYNYGGSK